MTTLMEAWGWRGREEKRLDKQLFILYVLYVQK